MKTIDRYVFKETFVPTLIALAALTFVFFTREIGALLEVIVRQSATLSEIWAFSVAILPNVLTFTIPMAVLVGILTGFGRMSSDSEAIAFRATGISMKRLLLPVMLLSILALAGNLALTALATAGLYVGGGIAPRILPALQSAAFLEAFGAKTPMADLQKGIPIKVILKPEAGLLGAAVFANDQA